MSRPKEPTRHRAMVEGGVTRLTYWRVNTSGYALGDSPKPWVDPWGGRHYWDDIDARRVIFKGEKPR